MHKSKSFGSSSDPNLLAFLENENGSTWISNFLRMNQLKDQICSSWFAPVGSASDYPLLAKWVIYGEVPLLSPLFIYCLYSYLFMATSMLHFFDHVFLQLVSVDPVLAHQMKYPLCTHYGLHLLAYILLTLMWRDQLGMPILFYTMLTDVYYRHLKFAPQNGQYLCIS